ncbi:Mob1/phocein family protein [Aphelenchoides avenae]|nr:Mob1/phocein family protein [Aphelenchus avenae]
MQRVAKAFTLLDSKELATLTNTLHLVRPPYLQAPPAKRSGGVGDASNAANDGQAMTRWSRVPASKSGSWGGYPTPTVLSCKPFAQTC